MAGCPAPAIERQQVEGMNRHQLRATLDDVIEENDVCVPPLILCLTQPNSQERAREGGREGGREWLYAAENKAPQGSNSNCSTRMHSASDRDTVELQV